MVVALLVLCSLLATVGAIGAMVLLGGGTALLEYHQRRRLEGRAGRMLEQAGLSRDDRGWCGAWGGRTVRVQVRYGERLTFGVAIQAPSGTLVVSSRAHSGSPIGDPRFDARWSASGALTDRALLSHRVRRVVGRMGSRLWIRDGWVGWELMGAEVLRPGELQEVLRGLAWVADPFWDAPLDPEARFEALVLGDPLPTVRRRTLEALAQQAPGPARALSARAIRDPDPSVRWVAARLLRRADVLAEVCSDEGARPALRRCAALDLAELSAPAEQLGAATVLAAEPVASLRRSAASLATAAGPTGEPCLVTLLGDPRGSVVRAAAEGLARVGSPGSVGPLRAALERTSRLGTLYPVVHAALDRVRARAAVRVGGLALASDEGGALSEVSAGGHLSQV